MSQREIELSPNSQTLDNSGMSLGSRIDERRKAKGISQAELARRVRMRQSTLNALINGDSRSSRSIVQLARELDTSPAYLVGETDDPHENAPPQPAPRIQLVTMQVALPSEPALAQMFEGLLLAIDRTAPVDEVARELAQLLPNGLSQLRGLLPESVPPTPPPARAAAAALATADPEPMR